MNDMNNHFNYLNMDDDLNNDKFHNLGANMLDGAGIALNTSATVLATLEITTNVIVPFSKFIPLVTEVANVLDQIVELYQSAEHNKRICGSLIDRVSAAEAAVRNLKVRRDQNKGFFN